MKILLDYVFPISVITPTSQASTGFLKQACLLVSPKSGQEANVGTIYECVTMAQVAARTDNTNAQQLFNAGMSKVFILLADDLELDAFMDANQGDFYTVLISDDFDDADIELAQATGSITISSYANLLTTTPDTITIAGTVFTAQSGAVTEGEATFQAATSNGATRDSLLAQINAHATVSELVVASAVSTAGILLTAVESGAAGNDITLAYSDVGGGPSVGASVTGLSGGKLMGGAGLTLGTFDGVVGVSSDDADFCADQAAIANRASFFIATSNGAKSLCYAFGSLLSNVSNWINQQYITMPVDDGVDELGTAESLFDDKISFVISDDEFGTRLALFACGGKAITAPYILKNLRIDLQSKALQWISANQPSYTLKEASLLEARLQEDVINSYITRSLVESGTVEITLVQDNFVANGDIVVAEPKALWRVFGELRQTV